MSKSEEAILEGDKLVSLNTRIRESVSMEIENVRLLLQMHTKVSKISKQSIVEKIILRGCESICEEIESFYHNDSQTIAIAPEVAPTVEHIPEEMTEIVSKSEEPEKPIENGSFFAQRYGTDIINNKTSIDEVNLRREEKLGGLDVPDLFKRRASK